MFHRSLIKFTLSHGFVTTSNIVVLCRKSMCESPMARVLKKTRDTVVYPASGYQGPTSSNVVFFVFRSIQIRGLQRRRMRVRQGIAWCYTMARRWWCSSATSKEPAFSSWVVWGNCLLFLCFSDQGSPSMGPALPLYCEGGTGTSQFGWMDPGFVM